MHSEITNTCLSTILCRFPHAGSRSVKTNSCTLRYNVPKERSSFLILYKHFHKDSSLLGSLALLNYLHFQTFLGLLDPKYEGTIVTQYVS
jgi:hypothetical protein